MTNAQAREWLNRPNAAHGIHLADDGPDDTWTFTRYTELAGAARRVAGALIADGVRPGDDVAVLMPTGLACIATFYAVWGAGAAFTPIAPPTFGSIEEYVRHVAAILRCARPRVLVTSTDLAPLAGEAMRAAGRSDEPWIYREGADIGPLREVGELALLQFTSGSTGSPRGVRIHWDNLDANIELIQRIGDWRDGDSAVSWLPLYHDMGLIGTLLSPIAAQGDLWLMRPDQFIREPARWLRAMAGKTHSASPPFALGYLARRVASDTIECLDLSSVRTLFVGAELVDPAALEAFLRLVGPAGFVTEALVPAFGLAEATLVVTGDSQPCAPLAIRVDAADRRLGQPVRVVERRRIGQGMAADTSGWLVGCGRPQADVGVSVVDEDGQILTPGSLGEIVVTGGSVADGYHGGGDGGATRFVDCRLHTGDAGFLYDGELFVMGRMGTSIKVRGRSVYVEDLETAVSAATRVSKSRLVVVSGTGTGTRAVAMFAEARPGAWIGTAHRVLRHRLGPDVEIVVVTGERGLIQRTSSGKPRRRHLWEAWRAGELVGIQAHGHADPAN
jgi:acyl-CoA synthetase (AMP-forming)/AMP-acid ligase II